MPRRPTPTNLRILRGNPGRRPINHDEPQPPALAPDVPEELIDDVVAADEWRRVIVPAIDAGIITAADRAVAIGYAEAFSQWREAVREAAGTPLVVLLGRNNYPAPNPARTAAAGAFKALRAAAAELGLTPSSRSRVTADPSAKRRISAVEAFKQKKGN